MGEALPVRMRVNHTAADPVTNRGSAVGCGLSRLERIVFRIRSVSAACVPCSSCRQRWSLPAGSLPSGAARLQAKPGQPGPRGASPSYLEAGTDLAVAAVAAHIACRPEMFRRALRCVTSVHSQRTAHCEKAFTILRARALPLFKGWPSVHIDTYPAGKFVERAVGRSRRANHVVGFRTRATGWARASPLPRPSQGALRSPQNRHALHLDKIRA